MFSHSLVHGQTFCHWCVSCSAVCLSLMCKSHFLSKSAVSEELFLMGFPCCCGRLRVQVQVWVWGFWVWFRVWFQVCSKYILFLFRITLEVRWSWFLVDLCMCVRPFLIIDAVCFSGCVFAYNVGEFAILSISKEWSNRWIWRSLGLYLGLTTLLRVVWFGKCSCCLANWCFSKDFTSTCVLPLSNRN